MLVAVASLNKKAEILFPYLSAVRLSADLARLVMPPITALSPSPPSPTLVTALIRKPSLASSNSSDPSDDTDDDQEEDDDASAPNIDQAKERLRVLEVAGVLVRAEKQNQDTADPPRVRRRPPPAPLRNHDDTERMREDIVVESPEERLGREEDAYAVRSMRSFAFELTETNPVWWT